MPFPWAQVDSQVLNVLKAVPQVAEEGVVEVLQHAPLPDDITDTFRSHDYGTALAAKYRPSVESATTSCNGEMGGKGPPLTGRGNPGNGVPSSFRIYFSANVRPVSFLSTILTLPKAPLPTTRRRRKWFRLTAGRTVRSARRFRSSDNCKCDGGGVILYGFGRPRAAGETLEWRGRRYLRR